MYVSFDAFMVKTRRQPDFFHTTFLPESHDCLINSKLDGKLYSGNMEIQIAKSELF